MIEYSEARINLPKPDIKILTRVCNAGMDCTYHCEHRKPHKVSSKCHIRCCDTPGKLRCIPLEDF